jgi:hypothetical protein
MSNSDDPVSKFPLFMLLCAQFVRGSVAIIVLIPLAKARLDGVPFSGLSEVLKGIVNYWWGLIRRPEVAPAQSMIEPLAIVPIWLAIALVVGFAIAPFERLLSAKAVPWLNALFRRLPRLLADNMKKEFFTPLDYTDPEYVKFMDWLFDRPEDKAYWEWELGHYFIYWNFPFVLFVAALLCSWISLAQIVVAGFAMIFLAIALYRSKMMRVVQQHFLEVRQRTEQCAAQKSSGE